jgi:hypothetical protein
MIHDNYLNPNEDNFSTDLLKSYPGLLTNSLRKENCFNPLIAYSLKDIFYKDDVPMLNTYWFGNLEIIRKGIQETNPGLVFCGLQEMYKQFKIPSDHIPFKDFLKFDGIFSRCIWVYRTDKTKIQDVLFIKNTDIPKPWKLFIPNDTTFREKIEYCFITSMGSPKGTIGYEEYHNAVKDIILGNVTDDTFKHLEFGLEDAKRLFVQLPSNNNVTNKPYEFKSRLELCNALKISGNTDDTKKKALQRYIELLPPKEKIRFKRKKGKGYVLPADIFQNAMKHFS